MLSSLLYSRKSDFKQYPNKVGGVHGLSLVLWNIDELRSMVKLSDEVYERAHKIGNEAGKKFYEGLISVLSLKGSTEAAIKYIEIQHTAAMPIAVLDEKNLWNINSDFLKKLLKQIDPTSQVEKIIKKGKEDPSKFIGTERLILPGAWGEIIAFYILNEPTPTMINIVYLIHLSTYVTTFTTVTIPEVYTASEDFLKLIEKIGTKNGAIEFLTRLLRRRYIPEDVYASALEAVKNRRELGFTSLRNVLEEHEAKAYVAERITMGTYGIIAKLQDIIDKSRGDYVDRGEIARVVGEVYSIVRSLEELKKEYSNILEKLNGILLESGSQIRIDRIRRVVEEISG
jgi:hypothetical protein